LNLHAGSAYTLTGAAHRLRHYVDACYLPPVLSQANRPVPGTASKIEHTSVGWLPAALFPVQ
jgi:hypothetical protein